MRGSRANLRAASAAASRCSRVVVSKTIPSVLARGERVIVLFVAFDIRRLDVVEREIAALLIAKLGHAPQKVGVNRRVPGLNGDKVKPQHLRLLRACRMRPRRGGAGGSDESDERAAADTSCPGCGAASPGPRFARPEDKLHEVERCTADPGPPRARCVTVHASGVYPTCAHLIADLG